MLLSCPSAPPVLPVVSMDQESTLDLIYEDSLSDYEISEDGEMNEVLPRKFESMEIDTSEDHEEGELPPDGGTCYSPTSAVFVGRDADFGPGELHYEPALRAVGSSLFNMSRQCCASNISVLLS